MLDNSVQTRGQESVFFCNEIKASAEKHLTSDKHVGRVGVKARFGVDAQGVHALIFLVEVDKGECGTFSRPVGVNPFRGLQGDS